MSIVLTSEQQQAIDPRVATPPRVVDPRTNTSYVLVPEAEYEAVREVLEDERRQHVIHQTAVRNAVGRLDDNSDCEPN